MNAIDLRRCRSIFLSDMHLGSKAAKAEFVVDFQGTHFGGIEVVDSIVHEGADGRRYLVIHGDQFDCVVHNARWIGCLGDLAYDGAIAVNRLIGRARNMLGWPYWSFSSWAKVKVKKAVNFIGAFQEVVAQEARRAEADGVICGHIHHAVIEDIGGIRYINTGDWVESCTAVVEDFRGEFAIVQWTDAGRLPAVAARRHSARVPEVA